MAASGKRITKLSRTALRADKSTLRSLTGRSDNEIEADIAADPLAAPVIAGDGWRGAELIHPDTTVVVALRLDRTLIDFFKDQGTSMEAAMTAALRAWAEGRR